jgi:glucan 1,3-beta-glucosidase
MATAYRAYASSQLLTFEKYQGWFFWNYKTETTPAWCFRDCVTRTWIADLSNNEQFADLRVELQQLNNR